MKKLLSISYWIGIVADAAATVLLFSPTVASSVLQPQPFEISAAYLYITRIAGALMLGWTVSLFWAQREPIERADIVLITLFPGVPLLAVAAILVVKSNHISFSSLLPMFILYLVVFFTFIPSYLWAIGQKTHS
jgi:drug/metabolite transporter (DMT)-like permease